MPGMEVLMRLVGTCLCVLALVSLSFSKDDSQASDLIKQHLDSIGNNQARAAIKNRVVEGTLQFQGAERWRRRPRRQGGFYFRGRQVGFAAQTAESLYHGERFVSDGKKTMIAQLKPGVYSNLGQFILAHNEILTEDLWGSALSTGWALENYDDHRNKLKYQGTTKVDGRDLQRIDYVPKHSDLEIQLYFEPTTFWQVLTVYELTIKPQMGLTERETAQQQETHYRLEERFADFKSVDNLTLPGKWTVQFTSDVPHFAELRRLAALRSPKGSRRDIRDSEPRLPRSASLMLP